MSDYSIQQIGPNQAYYAPFQGQQISSDTGVPYYTSNAGLKAGAVLSIPATLDFLPDLRLRNPDFFNTTVDNYRQESSVWKRNIDKLAGEAKFSEEFNNQLRRYKSSIPNVEEFKKTCLRRSKIAIPATLLATGCTIGSGMIIDAVRNNKARQTAEQYAFSNQPGAAEKIKNAQIAESGIPYHVSKTGKRLGAVLGGCCGIISAFLNGGMAKTPANVILRGIAFFAGGWILGAIYDNTVNSRARKAANNL